MVFLEDAFRVFAQRGLGKHQKQNIYKSGFFIGSGVFAGILLNDVWRLFNLPGNYSKTVVTGADGPEIKDERIDEIYQYMIVTAIMLGSIVTNTHVNEILPAAAGAFVGIRMANNSERKETIGFL